jgi:ATP-dependent Lon protease
MEERNMDKKNTLPLIPLRGVTIFPNMVLHFDVGRKKSIEAIDVAMLNNEDIFLVAQTDIEKDDPTKEDLTDIGTLCKIKQIIKLPGDIMRVLVEGNARGKVKEYLDNEEYFEVIVETIEEEGIQDIEVQGYFNSLKKSFKKFLKMAGDNSEEMGKNVMYEKNPYVFTDIVSSYLPLQEETKQELLKTLDIKKRIELLLVTLENESKVIAVQKKIASKMKKSIDDSQKEFYLREQLKFIQEELGEDDEEKAIINNFQKR